MELDKLLENILDELRSFKSNAEIHRDKGTKAAGARARKGSLALTKLFKEYRKLSIQE
jgi:hypothetical protein